MDNFLPFVLPFFFPSRRILWNLNGYCCPRTRRCRKPHRATALLHTLVQERQSQMPSGEPLTEQLRNKSPPIVAHDKPYVAFLRESQFSAYCACRRVPEHVCDNFSRELVEKMLIVW